MSDQIKIIAIAAMDKNRVIGVAGDLPWRLPDDLKTFKKLTLNRPIIMGRKTFESIGRPLPNRTNIILTRSHSLRADGCYIVHTVAEALDVALAHLDENQEIIIGGGAVIYNLFMPHLTHMVLTKVGCEVAGDTWFPEWDAGQWALVDSNSHPADARHVYPFEIVFLERT